MRKMKGEAPFEEGGSEMENQEKKEYRCVMGNLPLPWK